ncbi:MAG: DHH family phosphoesterase, partial [Bacteroidia bacterium]|nr:DHH family phosphoesterase [Bacteroidia bacterium]
MNKTSDKKVLLSIIKKSKQISILSHHNPDADALGSSLALYFLLKKQNKRVKVILPNAFPDFLNWMPASDKVIIYEKNRNTADKHIIQSDLIFLLDCNSFKRLGTDGLADTVTQSVAKKILIDHHKMPEKYFDAFYFDDKASSTCELIYRFSEYLKIDGLIDKKTAQCLYTGIMTDTGSFKFDSVTPHTMRIAANLMEYNIQHHIIQQNVFDTYSYERLKLVGYALSEKLKYFKDLKAAYIALSQDELKKFNYKKGDTEGLVNTALSIKDVKLSALI